MVDEGKASGCENEELEHVEFNSHTSGLPRYIYLLIKYKLYRRAGGLITKDRLRSNIITRMESRSCG